MMKPILTNPSSGVLFHAVEDGVLLYKQEYQQRASSADNINESTVIFEDFNCCRDTGHLLVQVKPSHWFYRMYCFSDHLRNYFTVNFFCLFSGKLVSPKWKNFKGLKLLWRDKIRLNNAIWRAWYMQCKTPTTSISLGIVECRLYCLVLSLKWI